MLCFSANRCTAEREHEEQRRRGVTPADAPALAALIAEALRSNAPETIAPRTAALRKRFQGLHYITP